jgi:DNA-binding NarL/FixJ family response regulator
MLFVSCSQTTIVKDTNALGLMNTAYTDLQLIVHASNGSHAVALCAEHAPDVVIRDVIMA